MCTSYCGCVSVTGSYIHCKCVWRDVTTPMNVALMQFPYERTICQQQALVYNITNIWLCSIYSFGWQGKTIFQRNLCLL